MALTTALLKFVNDHPEAAEMEVVFPNVVFPYNYTAEPRFRDWNGQKRVQL